MQYHLQKTTDVFKQTRGGVVTPLETEDCQKPERQQKPNQRNKQTRIKFSTFLMKHDTSPPEKKLQIIG